MTRARIRLRGESFALRTGFERPSDEAIEALAAPTSADLLSAIADDVVLRTTMVCWLLDETPFLDVSPTDEAVASAVMRALEEGRLVLDRIAQPAYNFITKRTEEPEREPEAPVERDWIEVQLQDRDGRLIAGAEVEIELPDGSKRRLTTSGEGRVSIMNTAPGNCKVRFLALHPVERAPEFVAQQGGS